MSAAALSLGLARAGLALDALVDRLERADLGEQDLWLLLPAARVAELASGRLAQLIWSLEQYGRPVPPPPVSISSGRAR